MNATLEFFHMYAEQIHWQVGEMRTSFSWRLTKRKGSFHSKISLSHKQKEKREISSEQVKLYWSILILDSLKI